MLFVGLGAMRSWFHVNSGSWVRSMELATDTWVGFLALHLIEGASLSQTLCEHGMFRVFGCCFYVVIGLRKKNYSRVMKPSILIASKILRHELFIQLTLTDLTNTHKISYAQVVSEYQTKGMDFILQAINHPTYLEDLTGLTELMKSAGSYTLDWDNDSENDDNDDDDCVEI